ncbi:MAG TPA: hypothetical protein VFG47_16955 [Geminicoccaceae bacterium]|nr:hypothetical protein [Geminicoccaceae bacterium]
MARQLSYGAGGLALAALFASGDQALAETLVLRDAKGDPFGTVLDLDAFGSDPYLSLLKDFELPAGGNGLNVLLLVKGGTIVGAAGGGSEIYFQSNDCSGPPFLLGFGASLMSDTFTPDFVPLASAWGRYTAAAVVTTDSSGGGARELWVASAETPQEVELFSVLNVHCSPTVPAPEPIPLRALAFPAELVDPDLHESFPPPYTLELSGGPP